MTSDPHQYMLATVVNRDLLRWMHRAQPARWMRTYGGEVMVYHRTVLDGVLLLSVGSNFVQLDIRETNQLSEFPESFFFFYDNPEFPRDLKEKIAEVSRPDLRPRGSCHTWEGSIEEGDYV